MQMKKTMTTALVLAGAVGCAMPVGEEIGRSEEALRPSAEKLNPGRKAWVT